MDGAIMSLHLNEAGNDIADWMADQASALRVRTSRLSTGARVIDAGVGVPGGIEAGVAIARICMGGLGHLTCTPVQIGEACRIDAVAERFRIQEEMQCRLHRATDRRHAEFGG